MAATVTYKGSTLTTVDNETKILKTSGKYMEDDITVVDETTGGSIVVTEEPDPHGGIIKRITADVMISGTISITSNGYYDVGSYANASVNVSATINNQNKSVTPTESQQSVTFDSGYTGLGTVTVAGISSTYVGTAITHRSSADLTANGATITAPAGYYSQAASKSVTTQNAFPPAISLNSSTGVITASNTFTAGYYAAGSSSSTYTMSTQAAKTVTPTESVQRAVSAGYFVTGNVSVAAISSTYVGTGVATKAAATYYTSTADQTIATSQYLTGAQTIKSVTYTGLTASAIASGVTVKIGDSSNASRITQVVGTLSFVTYYTGSSAPSSSLGNNGDIYLQS